MYKNSRNLLFLKLPVLFLTFTGCFSLSTFQSPQVLEKGQKSFGLGTAGFYDHESKNYAISEFDIFGRYGLTNQLDGGIKIFGLPFLFGGIQADLKYQLVNEPLFVSLDMASFYAIASTSDDEDENSIATFGFTPLILVGNRWLFSGVKINYFTRVDKIDFLGSSTKPRSFTNMPALVFGVKLGKKAHFIPEVNIYFLDGDTVLLFGLGLQGRASVSK